MKKIYFLLLTLVLLFVGCKGQTLYTPDFTLADGFTLEKDRISATLIGSGDLAVSDFLQTREEILIFADTAGDRYVKGTDALIPLNVGENRMVIRFLKDGMEKEYDLHITCIAIRSFEIELLKPEKTYHVGEIFDRSTIKVTAQTEDGKAITVTDYEPEYEFSSLGKSTVGIELDGYYESFSVMVTEEYTPTLDETLSADGVRYELHENVAILIDGTDKEGFFAVPRTVFFEGKAYPLTEIAPRAFENAPLTGIQIPNGVQRIADEAFSSCRSLEWVELPENMTAIGTYAFADCKALRAIEISEGIQTIEDGMFRGCEALAVAVLPETLTEIGSRAFAGCTSLSQIDLPQSLRVIGEAAFENGKALQQIVIGSLEALGDRAFFGCESLAVFAAGDIRNLGADILPEKSGLTVYMRAGSMLLIEAERVGAHAVFMKNGDHEIVALPTEFAIEDEYPYEETQILHLDGGKMEWLSNYEILYPKDACGYLSATLKAEDFEHTFEIFVVYTEDLALDTDTRGIRYDLDPATGKATLVYVPEWLKPSKIYRPEKEGLCLIPTTLWREDSMYVVVAVEEGVFDSVQNVTEIFSPILTPQEKN